MEQVCKQRAGECCAVEKSCRTEIGEIMEKWGGGVCPGRGVYARSRCACHADDASEKPCLVPGVPPLVPLIGTSSTCMWQTRRNLQRSSTLNVSMGTCLHILLPSLPQS